MSQDPRDAQIAQLRAQVDQANTKYNDLLRQASEVYAGLRGARDFLAAMPRNQGVQLELARVDAALAFGSPGG